MRHNHHDQFIIGDLILNIISVYTPQVDLTDKVKKIILKRFRGHS
jgi:hypothetical protein